ncbi:MAG: transcriptional regulator [Pseudomonadota bacterium]
MIDLLKQADITGWSVTRIDSGGTPDGEWQRDDITGASSKSMILIVANDQKTEKLTGLLAPLLDSYRLLLTIGNVEVVRGDRF